jgi:beta-glucosidase
MNDVFNEAFPRAIAKGSFQTLLGRQQIPEAKNTQDYLGLNYYTCNLAAFSLREPGFLKRTFAPGAITSKSGMIANEPEGMFEMIRWGLKFKVPILITENGIDDADDILRPRYLAQHIHQMWRAVNFNYPVKGYFHWTLVDNFEWERGWSQRFGLWELDLETQARKKRPSADFFAEICLNNGLSGEATARYAQEVFQRLFPN